MKNIERDYTVIAQVPDDVSLDDCEVVIHKASVSYPTASGRATLEYNDEPGGRDEVGIEVMSTRFVNPSGGEVLESD